VAAAGRATSGAARRLSLSALVPTHMAVRVMVVSTLLTDPINADFRIRLAISRP
jgi:hypothetical protein